MAESFGFYGRKLQKKCTSETGRNIFNKYKKLNYSYYFCI